jgi:hypothetical protein
MGTVRLTHSVEDAEDDQFGHMPVDVLGTTHRRRCGTAAAASFMIAYLRWPRQDVQPRSCHICRL